MEIISRPVLVISENVSNKFSPVVTVVALTATTKDKPLPIHVTLQENEVGVKQTSTILCDCIYSIDKRKIKSVVGNVSDEKMVQVNNALKLHLSLNS
ncbi:type II toxin-antitoxin system PemK/MazF family toxin [Paenibacillus chitinolyticus]|uniref:type II toxin-antitoxin system PemK/MazF family toxin n=1 Tax=Paenibacillus chitinolyticus TaxID=79263 RepID=UPI001C479BA4|nr:type II toxin-antitoxin system PemK/MazF family toxin [Paenibacillus chitinolyticus]